MIVSFSRLIKPQEYAILIPVSILSPKIKYYKVIFELLNILF